MNDLRPLVTVRFKRGSMGSRLRKERGKSSLGKALSMWRTNLYEEISTWLCLLDALGVSNSPFLLFPKLHNSKAVMCGNNLQGKEEVSEDQR